ncbi:similar to Saccharomyces cerevisiae YLR390W ECM19 Putative protein of unknown function [Maudiozyma saulgeensis]|uniref:Protein ECM19 n=1 Tax=Maudiozyma saulgeensis TaxID=1789683 RepID=A0A1X7RB36_9SACH|nr:similar to Saccharomyces cerevisiae YLR390W ECM19 Putative protein of unknown function [Kazachstania saulgeensis]
MARVRGFGITTVGIVAVASVYMGINFFQPIVVEQLRKDGNLRSDIDLPKFDKDGNVIVTDKDRATNSPGNPTQPPQTTTPDQTNP